MSKTAPAPIVVTHDGGLQFSAQIRSHRLTVDQPVAAGGDDAAPMPLELLGAALGTCIALYVQRFLHTRGLPYEGMRVAVEQRTAANPNRLDAFSVTVTLPTPLHSPYAEMLERVVQSCPAHGTLTHPANITVTVESLAPAVA